MNAVVFNHVIDVQLKRCTDVLKTKAGEYATHDRLHNFKVASALENVTPEQALAGMMAKHTVSVYDMCRDKDVDRFSLDLWNEKITDSINYLLLLRGLVEERQNGATWENLDTIRELLDEKRAQGIRHGDLSYDKILVNYIYVVEHLGLEMEEKYNER